MLGIIEVPFLTRFVQPDELGKASMYSMGLNILMIITLYGIDQACMRFYYEDNVRKLLKNCLKLTFIVYTIGIFFLFVFRVPISVYLFNVYSPSLIFVIGIGTILFVLQRYGLLIFQMEQNGFLYSILTVAFRFFQLIFAIVFVFVIGNNYTILVYSRALTLLVVFILTLILLRGTWTTKFKLDKRPNTKSFKEIFFYSSPIALSGIVGLGLQSFDKMAIKQWSSYHELGIYVSAFTIVSMLQIIQASFTTYWAPLALEQFVKNGTEDSNKVFFEKANSMVTVSMLLIGVSIIMGKNLIVLILGEKYRLATSLMPFLVLMPMMNTISETTVLGINFYYKVRWHLYIAIIIGLINLLCNFLFVPSLGGRGAAISIGISYLVFYVLRTHISLKFYKVNYHLFKFYSILFLVILYALYSTFYPWDFYNSVAGIAVLLVIALSYYNNVKTEILSLFLNKNAV
ncbi:MAG: polysaccharide biosynthesis protein [Bacteroidales bacterium]|nr:polysaccharide biosynthesis protein [Bacteroidales bacterium]